MRQHMDIEEFFQEYSSQFRQKSPKEVCAFLEERMAAAEAEGDNSALVTILNEAAGYYRNISLYQESVAAADRAVALLECMGCRDTVAYGTTLLNAATACRTAGDSMRALEYFIASLAVLQTLLPEDDHRLAGLYNNISAIHEEKGQWNEALEMLRKAGAIMEKNPDMPEDAAIVYTNLSMALFRQRQEAEAVDMLTKAEKLFRRAAECGGQSNQQDRLSPQYAAVLAGFGEAHFRLGAFDKAAVAFDEARLHMGAAFGKNRDYAVICQNCADAHEAAGNIEDARAMLEEADAVLRALGCPAA